MRVACVICSDAFIAFTDVAAIPCGHTFHVHCILQWIENSKSCPTCRKKTTTKNVLKLYFDSAITGDTQIDPDSLQNQIDSLKFQLVEKNQILKNAKEDKEVSSKITKQLRDEVVRLEKDIKEKDLKISAFREQNKYLDDLVKKTSKAEEEAKEAKSQLKLYKQVKTLLDENSSEIEETFLCNNNSTNSTENIKNLSTIACVLKSRLNKLLEEKRKCSDQNNSLASKLRETKKNLHQNEDKVRELQKEYDLMKEDLKALERENASLQKKIYKLKEAIASPSADVKNSVIHRLISESPAPLELKKRAADGRDILDLTPEVTRKCPRNSSSQIEPSVSQNETEASPYLKVKAASITALDRSKMSSNNGEVVLHKSDNSIFKENKTIPRSFTGTHKTWTEIPVFPSEDFGYDGMGGHHKVDHFPSPNRTKLVPAKKKHVKPIKFVTNKGTSQIAAKTLKDFFKDPFSLD